MVTDRHTRARAQTNAGENRFPRFRGDNKWTVPSCCNMWYCCWLVVYAVQLVSSSCHGQYRLPPHAAASSATAAARWQQQRSRLAVERQSNGRGRWRRRWSSHHQRTSSVRRGRLRACTRPTGCRWHRLNRSACQVTLPLSPVRIIITITCRLHCIRCIRCWPLLQTG